MPSEPTPTTSGIITDDSGERHIPESVRPDGSVRKAIKIRPGYKPAEDAVLYKNRTAESFRNRFKGGVIGAEEASSTDTADSPSGSAAAAKNAKRREARKKAATASKDNTDGKKQASAAKLATAPPDHFFEGIGGRAKKEENKEEEEVDPEAEKKKKARNLSKKLKQARDLQEKKEGGQLLLPEQIAKVIKINELCRELTALGFDPDAELLTAIGQNKLHGLAAEEAERKEKAEFEEEVAAAMKQVRIEESTP